jgi:predicted transposase/invertase (TIGR01784 family)
MSQIDFDPKDRDGQGLGEIPHKILFLCPKYVNAETPEPWREWLLAIDDSLDGQVDETHYHKACVQKILETIRQDSLTPQERARMKDEYSEEVWLQDKLEETLQQGLEQGLEQGRQEEKEEVALRLLAKGMEVVLVTEVTGLPLARVQALRQQDVV